MALVVVVLLIAAANVAIVMLAGPGLNADRPRAGDRRGLRRQAALLRSAAAGTQRVAGRARHQPIRQSGIDFNPSSLITGFLTIVTPAALQFVLQVVLFFGTLFFFILGRASFRNYAVNWFATREARCAR